MHKMKYACDHCMVDPHSAYPPRNAEIQLLGVWLCGHHFETAETIDGRLMRPIGCRLEDARWSADYLRSVPARHPVKGDFGTVPL
jgi:hypothetical protein